jgi:hypothetical protein
MKPITWRRDETNFAGQKAQVGSCEVLYQTVNFGDHRHRYSVWWCGGHLSCYFKDKLDDTAVEGLVSMVSMLSADAEAGLNAMKGTLSP